MTAQPITRISTPVHPQGPMAPFPGDVPPPPGYGASQPAHGAYGMPEPGMPQPGMPQPQYAQPYDVGYPAPGTPPAAPRRRTGRIVGVVAATLVVLAGLGIGALILFGPRTVDPQSVQHEIVRITQSAVGVAPADVRCPDKIPAQAGGTFTCTATVDQQPVTYDVRQDDDKGNLTITYDRLIKVTDLENALATNVRNDIDVTVNVTCGPPARTVVVDAPGTPITCTATNAADPTDSATMNVLVDAAGTPSYSFA